MIRASGKEAVVIGASVSARYTVINTVPALVTPLILLGLVYGCSLMFRVFK